MTPRTVLMVGNFRHAFCSEQHFAQSYEALGHRVVRVQEDQADFRKLPALAKAEGAHLFQWTRTWPVKTADALWCLDELRGMGIPSASCHLDRFVGLNREHQIYDEPFFRTDVLFSPDDGDGGRVWEEAKVNHVWMPPGVFGPECGIGVPDPRRYPHDVIFVGSHPYPHPEWEPTRTALIEAMQSEFGPRFKVWPERRNGKLGPPIRGQALANLYASAKVVVGDSCLVGNPARYFSDRVPESLGRRALLLHPYVEGAIVAGGMYEPDADLLAYSVGDVGRAVMLVERALAEPEEAEAIRAHGQATVLARDLYVHRMQTVLDTIEEQFGFPDVAPAPTRPSVVRVRHRYVRQVATFTGDQDNTVGEVWTDDTYRLTAADVRGKVVVDIGANVGAFSVLAAKLGAKRVVAYEPHPVTFGLLTANLAANGAKVVEARHLAVTGDGLDVQMVGSGGGAYSTTVDEGVPSTTLAEVLDEVGAIDVLKIDTEGAELAILGALPEHRLDEIGAIRLEAHGPVMPHLAHLDEDGLHLERWGAMVAKLASRGRLEMVCRPMVGGLMFWRRF